MKKAIILFLLVALSLKSYALYVEISLMTCNTLRDNIASSKKYLIDSLKVSGDIGGSDIKFLRDMSGAKSKIFNLKDNASLGECDPTDGQLKFLDLSDANIVDEHTYLETMYVYYTGLSPKRRTISERMFMFCSSLQKIILPNNITRIEHYAFAKCENLQELILPETIEYIHYSSFDYCLSLSTLNIPDNCKDSYFDFYNCHSLKSIYLGKSFNLEETGYYNCASLEMIYVSEENSNFISVDGVLYTKDKSKIVSYPRGRDDNTYYVIDNVKTIGNSAFRNNKKLKNLHLPSSITNIGYYSFECSSFSEIWLSATTPPSITSSSFNIVKDAKDFRDSCILFVPRGSYNSYWLAGGWGDFIHITEFDGADAISQCSKPQITLENGKLHFTSDTNGARFFYSIYDEDIVTNKESSGIVSLSASYIISVYAVSDGFTRSQPSYATLFWLDGIIENANKVKNVRSLGRAILLTSSNGTITLSGLNEDEEVALYSLNGQLLNKAKSHDNRVSFFMNTNERILICKINDKCFKFVLK